MTTILLIQDETPLARLIQWFLNDALYKVIVAASELAGVVRLIKAERPRIIVSNTSLSAEEKAPQFAAWKTANPGVLIIDLFHRKLGRQPVAEADASLMLPMDADDLIDAVRRLEAQGGGASGGSFGGASGGASGGGVAASPLR